MTVFGLKPMRHGFFTSQVPLSFYEWMGKLKEMDYYITVEVGKNPATRRSVLWPKSMVHCENLLEKEDTRESTRFLLSVDRDRLHAIDSNNLSATETAILEKKYVKDDHGVFHIRDEGNLIVEDFLESLTSSLNYGKLISGNVLAVPLLSLNGGPLVSGHPSFKERIQKISSFSHPVKLDYFYKLRLDQFDWNSAISFVVIVSCDEIDGYKDYERLGIPWRDIPCDIHLMEDNFLYDDKGPALKSESGLNYLGKTSLTGEWKHGDWDALSFQFKNECLSKDSMIMDMVQWFEQDGDNRMKRFLSDLSPDANPPQLANKSRHLFAARFVANYQTLKGRWVNKLRPFGEMLKPDEFYDIYLEITSAGQSGLNQMVCSHHKGGIGEGPKQLFSFQAPARFHDPLSPWFESPDNEDEEISEKNRIMVESWVTEYKGSLKAVNRSAFK